MQMWSRKPSQHYRFWEERHPSNLPSPMWQPSTAAEANTTSFATLAFVMLLHNQHCWSPAAAPALKAVYKNPSFAHLFGLILAPLLLFTEPLTAVGICPVKQVVLKKHHRRNIRQLSLIIHFSAAWFCDIRIHTCNFSCINGTFKYLHRSLKLLSCNLTQELD